MAWIALKFSASPPDREHPYGHGDDIETRIKRQFPGALVHIHPEPCLKSENRCLSETCTCPFRLDITLLASEPSPPPQARVRIITGDLKYSGDICWLEE